MASAEFARFLRVGIALGVEERVFVDRLRRYLAVVDRDVVAAGAMNHHETAAANIAGARIGHGHGEADGDRGIDRVAASLQNIDADARGERLLRHHHAVRGGDRLRAADLDVREVIAARSERQREQADEGGGRQPGNQARLGG